jgi:hypothetical protein
MNQRTSVGRKLVEVSTEEEKRYEIHLTSSLDVARFLISQGEPFVEMMRVLLLSTKEHSERWLIGIKIR